MSAFRNAFAVVFHFQYKIRARIGSTDDIIFLSLLYHVNLLSSKNRDGTNVRIVPNVTMRGLTHPSSSRAHGKKNQYRIELFGF